MAWLMYTGIAIDDFSVEDEIDDISFTIEEVAKRLGEQYDDMLSAIKNACKAKDYKQLLKNTIDSYDEDVIDTTLNLMARCDYVLDLDITSEQKEEIDNIKDNLDAIEDHHKTIVSLVETCKEQYYEE